MVGLRRESLSSPCHIPVFLTSKDPLEKSLDILAQDHLCLDDPHKAKPRSLTLTSPETQEFWGYRDQENKD